MQGVAEEVVARRSTRAVRGMAWLQPLQDEGLRLVRDAKPTANISPGERQRQVAWALGMLRDDWFAPIVEERKRALEESPFIFTRHVKSVSRPWMSRFSIAIKRLLHSFGYRRREGDLRLARRSFEYWESTEEESSRSYSVRFSTYRHDSFQVK